MEGLIDLPAEGLLKILWEENGEVRRFLEGSRDLHEARNRMFNYLNSIERTLFNIYAGSHLAKLHIIEKNNARECIRVFKNIIRSENEKLTGFSAMRVLHGLCRGRRNIMSHVARGFLCEFIFLLRGIRGESGIVSDEFKLPEDARESSLVRSRKLDEYSRCMTSYFKRYASGTDPAIVEKRGRLREKIIKYFGAGPQDWTDSRWQMKHIVKDLKTLSSLVRLEEDEVRGLEAAEREGIPFQITPYYLSLFNEGGRAPFDRSIRSQVIPTSSYVRNVATARRQNLNMDFMGEASTSPVRSVTRRYPQIIILKPFDSCPQICVYCQRNWEIQKMEEAKATRKDIRKGLRWLRENENITEVLITGGDPLTLSNSYNDRLLHEISSMGHIERIRIGTRIPVTIPFRIDPEFIEILSKYHRLGEREVCIITHFEHSSEITPEAIEAVKRVKNAGISIYNQQVFTYYNSFRFETSFLRKTLKLAGVDPYYSFNTKGKEETIDYRVPIARLLQERKEEARLLSGVVRTDEPVFNVPKLGKSHLRAWQDHEPVMILGTGERVYRFYPWESRITYVDDYLYRDVSIYDYLRRLKRDGEDLKDYRSIWYYF